MRFTLLALAATLSSAPAFATCDIYSAPQHTYLGNMIVTGDETYAGVVPGANDGTPYAGSLNRKREVFLGEQSPRKVGEVKGNQLLGLDGALVAVFSENEVRNADGKVVARTYAPYDASHVCEAAVALAGAAMFGAL